MASATPPPPGPLLIPQADPDAPRAPIFPTLLAPNPDPGAPTIVPAVFTPELCAVLCQELEPSAHDEPDFARALRLSQQRLDAIAADLRLSAAAPPPPPPPPNSSAIVPAPPPAPSSTALVPAPPPAPSSTALVSAPPHSSASSSRKRARAEMVRVTNISLEDHLRFRSQVRRARLTYEALRGIYNRSHDGVRDRGDLRAFSHMLARGLCPHRDVRVVGAVPGVFVGDSFFYRAELCAVGLHSGPQAGIGYVPASVVDEGHPVATSVVSSGGYLDDEDSGDVLLYAGSGGRPRNGGAHHADQSFQGGNLALHYSYLYGVEVRVIRGHDCDDSPSRKVYVYDGLYRVVESTYGPGKAGRDVCKFKLVRLPDQDELGSSTWRYAKDLKATLDSRIRPRGYITLDLSKGTEVFRVPVCNRVDEDSSLLDVEYIPRPEFPLATGHQGCHCGTTCGPRCRCVTRNGGGPVYNEDGTLVQGRPVVYECGARCGCTMSCPNRVTQRGMKHRLEVFRSRETEWGVRTLDLIQPGAFVCEYSGDVIAVDSESVDALLEEDESTLVDPRRFPERWRELGDASEALPDEAAPEFPQFAGPGYVLDVSRRRNFTAYISNSYAPNVFIQFVIRGNENEACPHMMVFAMDTIPPMRELSIDYGV